MVFGVEEARGLVFLPLRGETELRTDHVFQKMTESQPEFIFYDFSADAIQNEALQKCRGFVLYCRGQAKGLSGIKQYANPATPQDADLRPARESALHPSAACAPVPNPAKSALMPRSICTS